jgi:hypothetical protein
MFPCCCLVASWEENAESMEWQRKQALGGAEFHIKRFGSVEVKNALRCAIGPSEAKTYAPGKTPNYQP